MGPNCSKKISDVTARTKTTLLTVIPDIFIERGSKLTIVTFKNQKSTL